MCLTPQAPRPAPSFLISLPPAIMANQIKIKNKRASFEYFLVEKLVAGIQLSGTEIKSIRAGKVSLADSYCQFVEGELFVKEMHIAEYAMGTHYNHEPKRDRKLLLTKRELKKLENKTKLEKNLLKEKLRINDSYLHILRKLIFLYLRLSNIHPLEG